MNRTILLFATGALLLLGACKGETVSGIGGGGNGGESSTTTTTTTSTTTTTTSTTTTTVPGCHGDQAQWATITAGPFACQKNSDCCVVTNSCLSAVQIVKAADYVAAADAWPYCDTGCNDCITPAVNIACVNGACVGEVVDFQTFPDLAMNHCGEDPVTVGTPSLLTSFGCGG